ncbi:calcium-binding protein [Streptomyces sp. NPDC051453]|uniref:calcium-binding protein n=1 Tax=Streptomyces sp. NPDC051453 TaxID=3154941 RepID=UPI0034325656
MSQHSRKKLTSGKKVTLGASALAASGLAVGLLVTPSAMAGGTGAAEAREQSKAAAADASAAKAAAPKPRSLAASTADSAVVSGVTVNGGNSAQVGTTNTQTITVKWTLNGGSKLYGSNASLWRGTDTDSGMKRWVNSEQFNADTDPCVQSGDATYSCTATYKIDPQTYLTNEDAGAWKISLWAVTDTGDVNTDNAMTWYLKRWSRLSNNAAPEPVAKGKTITITGKLERANWDTHKYAGYTQQTVRLQERSLTGSYATTSSHITGTGSLAGVEKQTRTATTDRCYRYKFEGTSTTPPVTATGDCVDVR